MRLDAGADVTITPSCIVSALKHTKDGWDNYRARFFVDRHKDRGNRHFIHKATTLQHSSLRLFALASILAFNTCSLDATQAYRHSSPDLLRNIFIKLDVFSLQADELQELAKLIYGPEDFGDYWDGSMYHE